MFYAEPQKTLSLLLSLKYSYSKDTDFDYSSSPRPCHNFAFMLQGEGVIFSNGEKFSVKAGDILFIPKGSLYIARWIAQPKVIFHSLHFSFSPNNDPMQGKKLTVQSLANDDFQNLYSLLQEIERTQFSKSEDSFFALSSFYAICGKLLPRLQSPSEKQISSAILPAVRFLERNYSAEISVDTLATLCFLSSGRFYHLFKEQLGVSPIVYKNRLAVSYAAQALLYYPEKSIKAIAEEHGFPNLIYFERIFKKQTGKTPSAYRKEKSLL